MIETNHSFLPTLCCWIKAIEVLSAVADNDVILMLQWSWHFGANYHYFVIFFQNIYLCVLKFETFG